MFFARVIHFLQIRVRSIVTKPSIPISTEHRLGSKSRTLSWNGSPVLIQLNEPAWGPLPTLSLDPVHANSGTMSLQFRGENLYGDSKLPSSIGVVRFPFASTHKTLHEVLWCPREENRKHCFISAKFFHQFDYCCLVDHYSRSGSNGFRLVASSTNLVAFLKQQGFTVGFLPDQSFDERKIGKDRREQSTNSVLMVAPTGFQFNTGAAEDNKFMSMDKQINQSEYSNLRNTVLEEFHCLYHSMTKNSKINVNLFEHDPEANTPDAVFPNNWFSTHKTGSGDPYQLVLYPLKVPNRRRERRSKIIEFLKLSNRDSLLDLTELENKGKFLEGTGSLVLDRVNRVVFMSISERSNLASAEYWTKQMKYSDLVHFQSVDKMGAPIYHTNVLMSIGSYFAIICLEALTDFKQRQYVADLLGKERTLVAITHQQMQSMCGNVIELLDESGLPVLCMSSQAYNAFTSDQIQTLKQCVTKIIHSPINVLETTGGGSVRCTIAELF
eukprot:g3990.t1